MMSTTESLLACFPPVAYDRSAPGVRAEAAVAARVLDDALAASGQLLKEQRPDQAQATFADWERNYALPDACVGGPAAADVLRRLNLMERVLGRGDLSRGYMLAITERLGYSGCTISEPALATCEASCEAPLYGTEFVGQWTLHVPVATAIHYATCESPCDAPLATWGNTQLECVINRRKPAHTKVLFAYPV